MILCCGEALIDMLPRQSTDGETAFAPYAGGAVFNTAIALGRLGASAGFYSGLSTDFFGELLVETLAKSKVTSDLAHRSDRPTTLAFVRLVDGQASYAFYDENTAGRMLTPADLPALGAEISTVFAGGISLMAEPCGAAYETLALNHADTRVIAIDPNIRPSFIRDEPAYRARISRLISAADIVKLSDEDMAWLDLDPATILKAGVKLFCLTKGADGVTGFTPQGRIEIAAPRVEVIDTVGAGDTFNAGLLAGLSGDGLLSKQSLADLSPEAARPALSLGVRAAAVTVSRAGANPPWATEL